MNDAKIAQLIARRNKLLCRIDGLYDHEVVARIDAKLSAVPAGVNNEVDLALGRSCATPTPRADYAVSSDMAYAIVDALQRDMDRAAERNYIQAQVVTVEQAAPLAAEMRRKYHAWAGCAGNSADEYDSSTEGHW